MINAIKNIIKNIGSPLSKEEQRLLEELKTYTLSANALDTYRHNVKNNDAENYAIAKAKIVRNIILGKTTKTLGFTEWRQYGNLEIKIDKHYKLIENIKNNIGRYAYNVDQRKKEWLDRELGITYKNERKVG